MDKVRSFTQTRVFSIKSYLASNKGCHGFMDRKELSMNHDPSIMNKAFALELNKNPNHP
jgi:hypothetical protein